MSDEVALARVLELEDVIGRLQRVKDAVGGFGIDAYRDAGGGLWAGQKRNRFMEGFEAAKSSHSRIGDQIGEAIGECKRKQRSLAFSINAIEHPALSAQAIAIALT
ncbi:MULTISPECIES: hypothetical protein [unclassified Leifsonia]|uniref:hypothetical protein n=1 Tax=unclassified Leifsonia TaxID=2663824 RepID=UPI0008A745E6|nr:MULTISPECIES: hypothetical protein [unclassified Leifsonia]SEI17741.1 hypothetical protein SAMN04515694_1322 [Leifsonia sp. CL154]SFM11218.1 hypothetical protein SAMN04515692_1312 [Leifsonia sp. CL147]